MPSIAFVEENILPHSSHLSNTLVEDRLVVAATCYDSHTKSASTSSGDGSGGGIDGALDHRDRSS